MFWRVGMGLRQKKIDQYRLKTQKKVFSECQLQGRTETFQNNIKKEDIQVILKIGTLMREKRKINWSKQTKKWKVMHIRKLSLNDQFIFIFFKIIAFKSSHNILLGCEIEKIEKFNQL